MIKFFRRIRQRLLSEKRLGKYLVYAIGEIVLVVIGILIALQINNWNLDRQDRKTERANLLALKEEFAQNKSQLESVVQTNVMIIDGAERMIASFQPETMDTITEQTLVVNASQAVGKEINFAPETGVLTEIISSGELKLLRNEQLKHKLAGFGSKVDQIEQQEREVYEYRMLAIRQMIDTGNMKRAYEELGVREPYFDSAFKDKSNRSMLNSLPFLNQLILFQSSSRVTTEDFYDPLLEEMDKILEMIEASLGEL